MTFTNFWPHRTVNLGHVVLEAKQRIERQNSFIFFAFISRQHLMSNKEEKRFRPALQLDFLLSNWRVGLNVFCLIVRFSVGTVSSGGSTLCSFFLYIWWLSKSPLTVRIILFCWSLIGKRTRRDSNGFWFLQKRLHLTHRSSVTKYTVGHFLLHNSLSGVFIVLINSSSMDSSPSWHARTRSLNTLSYEGLHVMYLMTAVQCAYPRHIRASSATHPQVVIRVH